VGYIHCRFSFFLHMFPVGLSVVFLDVLLVVPLGNSTGLQWSLNFYFFGDAPRYKIFISTLDRGLDHWTNDI